MSEYDLLVLGGGTGGYVAAIRAAQLGMKVAVVERNRLGGTCLHRGCIPSKALLRTAEVYHTLRHAREYGLTAREVGVDWPGALARKDRIVAALHKGVQGLFKKHGITVVQGTGTLMPPSIFAPNGWVAVQTDDGLEKLEATHILIATGSRPRTLGIPVDGQRVFTTDEALSHPALPRSVVILGGGAIGMEWASLYSDLGAEVTVLELLPRILPQEDEEVAAELQRLLTRRGVRIVTGARVRPEAVETGAAGVRIRYEAGGEAQAAEAEMLLIAVGREPNSQGIGLENFPGIRTDRGYIVVDECGRTGQPGVYAIGDVVGGGLAHVAAHQGIVAVETMAGLRPHPVPREEIPRCTYTRPEVASVGLTEAQARERGHEVKVGRFPFRAIGKALVHGEPDGFAKVVADAHTGDLLGVHIIGPGATNLIGAAGLARLLQATAWEVSVAVWPHPTLSEILGEAALAVEGRAIHL
ncbi:MAG: dihydrolipoyl dehydrogenase [Firmicutes bacterium]|nr:dihydrolipoyl dehydrogenase [Bacillota bacterium]